jgi:4-amino-4-deoxy-L-arabinose transferase-like glycosyltransferase
VRLPWIPAFAGMTVGAAKRVDTLTPFVAALAALTLLRLAVAAATPLAPDEAYYWVWSRAFAPGYLDHPPMVALWIAAGTALAGDGALGVRLLAPLAAALGSLLLVQAGDDLLPGRRAGITAAVLLNATLLFGVGAVTMTPDTPLLLFWTATLWAMARLHATGRAAWWLVAGVAAGLALDSKYSALLLAPAILLWLVAAPGWWRRWQMWLGGLLAMAVFAPVLWWNAAHGWASFARQGGRTGDWHPYGALQFVSELIGSQLGLATPLIGIVLGAGIAVAVRRAWRRDPAWALLATFTVVPALVFLEHALGDRVQGNWPAVIYPAAAVAAAGLAGAWSRLRTPAVALGFAVTLLVYAQAALAPLPLPAKLDPTLRLLGGWPAFAGSVADVARAERVGFVAVEPYGDAAELARLAPPDLTVLGVDPRWAYFELPDAAGAVTGRTGLLLRAASRADPPDAADWDTITPLPDIVRARGVVAERYRVYRVTGRAGDEPIVVLPRPR